MEHFGDNIKEALRRASLKRKAEGIKPERPTNSVTFTFDEKQLKFTIHAPDTKRNIKLPCPYDCKEVYTIKKELQLHLHNVHKCRKTLPIILKYYCHYPKCLYNKMEKRKHFHHRTLLTKHYAVVHHERTFLCDNCDSNFALLSDFKGHLKICKAVFTKMPKYMEPEQESGAKNVQSGTQIKTVEKIDK